ncbi:outer membrane beta-barrel protein [Ekhidna sp.]|uniref:outer membrane beta-barrel protein n=1 Tax=Ekhidna sp. TaxID=2608089 RepID=UPI003BAA840A
MKKTILLFGILTAIFISSASAQKMNAGVSLGPVFPTGDASDFLETGFRFDGSVDYYFNDKFDMGVEVGYMTMSFEGIDESQNMVPLQITAGYHNDLGSSVDLYGELGGGVFFISNSINNESDSYGGISPRLGAAFELQEDLLFLDTNINYTSIFTEGDNLNLMGLNIGLLYTIR